MSLDLSVSSDLLLVLLPELVLTAWAMVLLLFVAWRHQTVRHLRVAGWLTLAALLSTAVAAWWLWYNLAQPAGLPGMLAIDDFRWVTDWLFLGCAALTVLISFKYLEREALLAPEYYILLIFATLGMMLMSGGEDLMVIFLGLELMSVAVYVLAGFDRKSPRSAEAALKYFLLGAFASGFLLYGIALIYGATGTTNLTLIGIQVGIGGTGVMLYAGVALLLVGFAFKVAAVPFHMWAPDVYDGAPTPVTAFMATGVKAAAFAALFRVLTESFAHAAAWQEIVWWLAVVTMVGGNVLALAQRSLKRMLAYSSVAHAGYLLVAVASGKTAGTAAFIVYLVAYTLMTVGAFAVLAAKGRRGESDVLIDDLAGLATRRPWLAFALAVCMLSLLGFPGTAGFIGKWYILVAATGAGQNVLAAILVLASVVSAGYYLPVIMAMYM
ncbi:MAG TPA: NADH-quinone oxidoreductase subunit N, partial [Gemmatimonadales bacterium]|nr:NADH-quinone oxidoreductase subunit N [Gemmatimonadales bacterium]